MTVIDFFMMFILSFINIYLYYKYVMLCVKDEFKITKKILVIITATTLLMVIKNYMNISIRVVFSYLLFGFMFYIIDKSDFIKKVCSFFIITFYGMIVELIIYFILNKNGFYVLELSDFKMLYLTWTIILTWFSSLDLIIACFDVKKFLFFLENKFDKLMSMGTLLIFLIFGLNFFVAKYYLKSYSIISIFIWLITIDIIIYAGYKLFKIKQSKKNLQIELDYLKDNNKIFQNAMKDYKCLKHNIMTDFLSIKAISPKKVRDIIDEKAKEYVSNEEYIIDNVIKFPEGLQSLLYLKVQEAKVKKVNCYFEVKELLKKQKNLSNKEYLKYCKIIGIIFDNAIEASSASKSKIIYISYNISSKIIIWNTFCDKIDLIKLSNFGYSTKGKNRGLGLNFIKTNYKEVKIETNIFENSFQTIINLN